MPRPRFLLPTIVVSVLWGSSLWFAVNAVLDDLGIEWNLPADALSTITSVVQLGFIAGTLVFAFTSIPDRFSPRKVFLVSSIAAALANVALTVVPQSFTTLLILRFITGFFLAGIYPVGMKITAGWYSEGLGRAIGYLVGALVLGTAIPHLITSIGGGGSWTVVIYSVSVLAVLGGIGMFLFVPDGPYIKTGAPFNPRALVLIFRSKDFRASAFGYFGHMWELYAFWVFVPVFLMAHVGEKGIAAFDVSLWSFAVIGIGFAGCAVGGVLSERLGSARIARYQLTVSGICCLLSPLMFYSPTPVFIVFLLIWGATVVGDSPQFSALNAATAPRQYVGSALTIANCIGFLITIVSIELVSRMPGIVPPAFMFIVLLLGPVFGLYFLRPLLRPATIDDAPKIRNPD